MKVDLHFQGRVRIVEFKSRVEEEEEPARETEEHTQKCLKSRE